MITAFAPTDDAGNRLDDDEGWPPTVSEFGNALQVWSFAQERPTSVAEAALVFNTTPELIKLAVEEHYWMFIAVTDRGEFIEHEGE